MKNNVEMINIKNLKSLGPYSHATKVNNMYFFSGQLGFDFETKALVSQNVQEQTKKALENISMLLNECNLSKENIAKVLIFVSDLNDFDQINEIYAQFMDEHKPARSLVQVARIPLDAKIEIEVIAIGE